MKYRWTLAPPQPLLAGQLASGLKISPLLAQCLVNRGFSEPATIDAFLQPRLKQLADPFLLPGMGTAVERLFRAREAKEPLVIFGDYDVDGVTSTALLTETLRALGWTVNYYLPHRMEEGYGLSREGVENCLRKHPVTLLLAVDCGSTAGLAFRLAHALVKRGRELGVVEAQNFDVRPLLDLVALGTIADLVPLTGENRILVTMGLERLHVTPRPGLVALKKVAQVNGPVGVYETGF